MSVARFLEALNWRAQCPKLAQVRRRQGSAWHFPGDLEARMRTSPVSGDQNRLNAWRTWM